MDARIVAIVEQYKAGDTMQVIGNRFGLSRERVRQLLQKHGLSRRDGGAHIRSQARADAAAEAVVAAREERKRSRPEFPVRAAKTYGMSSDEWHVMLIEQAGRCAVCGDPMDSPVVDHRHADGTVRGLLCPRCNALAGWIEKDRELAADVIAYLDNDLKQPDDAVRVPTTQVERDRLILRMLDEGLTQVDIGKRLGMGQPRVNDIVVKLRAGRRRWQKKATV